MSEKSENKLQDKIRRFEQLKRLDQRLINLSERKIKPMNTATFCKKYKFIEENICRWRKLHHVPRQETWVRLDAALKKEKV